MSYFNDLLKIYISILSNNLHLIFIVGVCTYSSLFVSHNILVKALLSIVSITILNYLQSLSKNEITKSTIENISIKKEGTIDNLIILHKWNWLNVDTPFLNTARKIEYLNSIDKQLYIELCSDLNKFSKTYYTNIRKNEKTNYKNLEQHKQNIQALEMLYDDILNIFLNISYVTSSHVYKDFLKIPSLIKFMDDLMKQRIFILKQKYKLN
jgi:hypothetical protein